MFDQIAIHKSFHKYNPFYKSKMPFIYAKTHQDNFKTLPSLQLISKLIDLCQKNKDSQNANFYDRKNHQLFINNPLSFEKALFQNQQRTMACLQKQLKMVGFRKRKILNDYNDETFKKNDQYLISSSSQLLQSQHKKKSRIEMQESQQGKRYMYVWKSNKNKLLQKQLEQFEEHLSKQICKAIQLKENLNSKNKKIDSNLQGLLFKTFLQQNFIENKFEQINQDKTKKTISADVKQNLQNLKQASNMFQSQQRELVKQLSGQLGKQLQLYRLLIYKDNQGKHKK